MFEQALDPGAILLINKLSGYSMIADHFYLAGGTGLALHLGHRKSEDIDLFCKNEFNVDKYINLVSEMDGQILTAEKGTIHCIINEVKLTFITYPYHLIKPLENYSGLPLAAIEDITCMKCIAIAQRAEKKDFFDIYELVKLLGPKKIKNLFLKKYGQKKSNCYHILKSFFYFNDVEASPDPVSLNNTTWEQVKAYLLTHEKKITSEFLC